MLQLLLLYANWDLVVDIFKYVVNLVKSNVIPAFKELYTIIRSELWSAFSDLLEVLIGTSGAFKLVEDDALSLGNVLKSTLGTVVDGITSVVKAVSSVFKTISSAIQAITSLLTGDWTSAWKNAARNYTKCSVSCNEIIASSC